MREAIVETIPRLTKDARRNAVEQLKSSMQTLNAPMVLSCGNKLDAAFLKLGTHPSTANKSLPQLAADIQTTLEQFLLLGTEVAKGMCVRIANIIRVRVPENAPYACRVVQHLTRML
uniref:Uncharacterized protein n=1 Tax=Parascaris equorum TaxID=6256 RepID=A0A914R832_PAREQ